MTLADTKAAKLRIPYLGPEPPPSRQVRLPVQITFGAVAVLLWVRAALYVQRAGIDRQIIDATAGRAALQRQLESNQSMLSVLGWIVIAAYVLAFVAELNWRRKRRPKEIKQRLGEAYVESPISWVMPVWMRAAVGATAVSIVLIGITNTTNAKTKLADLPMHRNVSALGALVFSALWIALLFLPHIADRVHDERMAWSGPYRDDPTTVPFFPAISEWSGGSTNVIGGAPVAEPEGLLWFLSTGGLILLLMVGTIVGIASVADLVSPKGSSADLLWIVGAVAAYGIVIRAFVRRYRRNHPPPSGPSWG